MTAPGPVAVSGASGLVGRALLADLAREGIPVRPLVRDEPGNSDEIPWDPAVGVDPALLEGVDAVVHLAGEPLLGRWTPSKKEAILRSRRDGTRNLCASLASMERPPRVLVSASAVGYYGDRDEEPLTEVSTRGDGFLSDVCAAWEGATAPAEEAGVRVVHLRTGVVLARDGGALGMMLPFFRAGLGGKVGSGRQFMPWIGRDDLVRVIRLALDDDGLAGPVNAVAASTRNREFTDALGAVLRRPTIVPLPGPAARIVFGELADALLLASQNIVPTRLRDAGFDFRDATIHDALSALLSPAPTATTKAK